MHTVSIRHKQSIQYELRSVVFVTVRLLPSLELKRDSKRFNAASIMVNLHFNGSVDFP